LDRLTYFPIRLTDELQKKLAEIVKEGRTVYEPPYDIPYTRDMKKRRHYLYGADQLIKNYLQIFIIKALRLLDNLEENKMTSSDSLTKPLPLTGISEVKSHLDENFKEKINVEELCFILNTNKTTLTKEFKRFFGHTIIDYVNIKRVEYTKLMLKREEMSLTEIAGKLNLSSVHYLTTLFKKLEKMTPTEYLLSLKLKMED
jgi:AraC-like DNA-binding protein